MSVLMSRPVLRWIVPAFATVAVLGGGAAIGAITAAADPSLPPRSPAQLLVDLQTAGLDSLSGTIVTRADLGLPAVPGLTGPGGTGPEGANLSNLLTGTHTVRVWYSGPDKARVALLDTLGETDVIANGTDLWTWSSQANQATHRTISGTGIPTHPRDVVPSGALTPQQVADMALAAVNPTTEVTTRGTASIAGRDAYELVLSPRDPASLVGSIRLAVDAQTHVPLRVQIYANSASTPAIEVGFTSVSFVRPDPGEFVFNPPPGATVTDGNKPDPDTTGNSATAPDLGTGKPPFTVIGTGWTSVAVVRAGKLLPPSVLAGLPAVSGAWGSGKLLRSSLLTALITDDGRLLVGAVEPDRLYAAAADPAAKLPA
jgi:outer membrane lipoprotein-sorting protein